jgi:hypothetical protein
LSTRVSAADIAWTRRGGAGVGIARQRFFLFGPFSFGAAALEFRALFASEGCDAGNLPLFVLELT